MKKEFDLELLLQQDFNNILDKINIDSNLLLEFEALSAKYENLLTRLSDKFSYDINSNIEFAYSFDSYVSSTQIEGEEIDDTTAFHDVNKLKEYYKDINVIEGFYYNFNSNIKKINKCVSKKDPGTFRSEINKHVIINTPNGNLLVADYKNIEKYLNQLVNLNLLKGNNIYVEAWVMHCLFEAIHPFCDGNGRVGRFILNNHLNQQSVHKTYLDKTILKYRPLYYEALFDFQVKQDFESSIRKFFELVAYNYNENLELVGVYLTNCELLRKLISRDDFLSKYIEEVVGVLFTNQIMAKKKIYKILNRSDKTNKKILDYLVDKNYLAPVSDTLFRPCY